MFIGWLIQVHGRDLVLDFIYEYIRAPGRERNPLSTVFRLHAAGNVGTVPQGTGKQINL